MLSVYEQTDWGSSIGSEVSSEEIERPQRCGHVLWLERARLMQARVSVCVCVCGSITLVVHYREQRKKFKRGKSRFDLHSACLIDWD